MELIIATTNRGKFLELEQGLRNLPVVLRFLGDFPGAPRVEEDQQTFAENALKKARAVSLWSGKPALADDSGLVVPALDGRPGILSARFAGAGATDEENRKKLLEELRPIPSGSRQAFFLCLLAFATPDGKETTVEGRVDGLILPEPRGSGGFGYDPLFYLPDLKKTMAELSLKEKNRISHRGQALQKMNGHSFISLLA